MGAGNPTISRETETQVPAACQPQPRKPHIIKLIPQLQKPTRKISDTWIIDTGKRETRYQLVKVHQTIRQPHICICIHSRERGDWHWPTDSWAKKEARNGWMTPGSTTTKNRNEQVSFHIISDVDILKLFLSILITLSSTNLFLDSQVFFYYSFTVM